MRTRDRDDARELRTGIRAGAVILAVVCAAALLWGLATRRDAAFPPRAQDASRLIDINAADATTLRLLPGIGPALAGRIVEDRETHGAFASVEDLQRVRGIGPRISEGVREFVVVGPPSAEAPDDQDATRP
ncbi:MAG: ComEA family DNA-binding protein [Phycisphaerales bacterium]|nr:MAG: ComEA family DNA-binding protein [Phycisphaerales bacterium]